MRQKASIYSDGIGFICDFEVKARLNDSAWLFVIIVPVIIYISAIDE